MNTSYQWGSRKQFFLNFASTNNCWQRALQDEMSHLLFPVACDKLCNQNSKVTSFLLGKSLLCLHAQMFSVLCGTICDGSKGNQGNICVC